MRLPILVWVYDRRKVGSPKKEATVELRITYKGRQKFVSTGVRVLPKQWRHDMVGCLDAQKQDNMPTLQEELKAMMKGEKQLESRLRETLLKHGIISRIPKTHR